MNRQEARTDAGGDAGSDGPGDVARQPAISVIIPTYNRAARLGSTLKALAASDFDLAAVEVIVVDDGSSDDPGGIFSLAYPFQLRYLQQANQGDAIARNTGARASRGDLLIFLDDDISVAPALLRSLAEAHGGRRGVIAGGLLVAADPESGLPLPVFTRWEVQRAPVQSSFADCRSGLLAISRDDYMQLGMMEPLAVSGSSIWCDVEFAYRAHQHGFIFVIAPAALAVHYDHAERNLAAKARRMYRAGQTSVLLFERHPPLSDQLPMFRDMTPIKWRRDPPWLVARKLVRPLASSRPVLRLLATFYAVAAAQGHPPLLCRLLERWFIGGHIFRGYRQGVRARAPRSGAQPPSPRSSPPSSPLPLPGRRG